MHTIFINIIGEGPKNVNEGEVFDEKQTVLGMNEVYVKELECNRVRRDCINKILRAKLIWGYLPAEISSPTLRDLSRRYYVSEDEAIRGDCRFVAIAKLVDTV